MENRLDTHGDRFAAEIGVSAEQFEVDPDAIRASASRRSPGGGFGLGRQR
jgi:hypothetical protein